MKLFKDNQGRSWPIAVNVAAVKHVRDRLGVDLLELAGGELLERLIRDPVLLCDVVYVVCQDEADKLGVSDVDFGAAMAGDAIEQATRALLESLADFSPSPRDRASLKRVIEKTWAVMERARDLIDKRIENGELDKIADRLLAQAGGLSGTAPESPASIPVD